MVEFYNVGDGCWRRGFAGDTLNVAWTMRAVLPQTVSVEYVTCIGRDDVSDAMLSFFEGAGIGTAHIKRDPKDTVGLYTIATDDHGERSFSYWRGSSAARRLADDGDTLVGAFRRARLVYLSGITAAILGPAGREHLLAALEAARGEGTIVAYDPNFRRSLWESTHAMRDFTQRVTAFADILLPTFDDEAAGFGDATPADTVARLVGWGCREIAVKNGTAATLVASAGTNVEIFPTQTVRPLDTTGAGDSFNGGYLAARLIGASPEDATRAAQSVAARVVLERGALVAPQKLHDAFSALAGD